MSQSLAVSRPLRAAVVAYLLVYLVAAAPVILLPAPVRALRLVARQTLERFGIVAGAPVFRNAGGLDEKLRAICPIVLGRGADGRLDVLYVCPDPPVTLVEQPLHHGLQRIFAQTWGQVRSEDPAVAGAGQVMLELVAETFCGPAMGLPARPTEVHLLLVRTTVSFGDGHTRPALTHELGWRCGGGLLPPEDPGALLDAVQVR